MRTLTILFYAVGLSTLPVQARAQDLADYPAKPVRIIVASGAGGGTDYQTRMFAQKLSDSLKRPFVVENRPGAGGSIGYAFVGKSAADGYTLLATANAFTIGPALTKAPLFDPIKDFAPIALVTQYPLLILVHPSVPARSIKELIALAKAKPGSLNVGVSNGSTTHLAAAWFASLANVKIAFVPYKATPQIITDTIAGHVQMLMANVVPAMPQVKAGKLRALAVSTAQRYSGLPDLPTVSEAGVNGYDMSAWNGWLAPAKTPGAIVAKLSAEFDRLIKTPDVIRQIESDGGTPIERTPEQFRTLLVEETARWRTVVRDSGMRLE